MSRPSPYSRSTPTKVGVQGRLEAPGAYKISVLRHWVHWTPNGPLGPQGLKENVPLGRAGLEGPWAPGAPIWVTNRLFAGRPNLLKLQSRLEFPGDGPQIEKNLSY